jgi:glycyl-tRNA synthetase beta chain
LKEFLLEIYTEEMPAAHIKAGLAQLEEGLKKELAAHEVELAELKTYGTNRRLVVFGLLAPAQQDREELIIGPPRKVAFDEQGQPTPTLRGFARAKGIPVKELEVIQTEKGEYVGTRKKIKGRPTSQLLAEIIPSLISSLSFPKMMRWGENPLRFSRPIHNILCLFSGKVIKFAVGGVKASAFSFGHKVHSPQKFSPRDWTDYRRTLRQQVVIVEQEERKKMIIKQIEAQLTGLEAEINPDEDLLEKWIYDVEYPYVFLGKFPEKYLKLPLDVLSTAMKEGQSLFAVIKKRKQLPYFLGLADTRNDRRGLIKSGNERVLQARLEDALFFWNQDTKISLEERKKDLSKIIFQETLGTYQDKARRLANIIGYLAKKLELLQEKKDLVLAAELAKVDLLTEMVREFPSLQGKIGGLYARQEGYPLPVWKAIYEHYLPQSWEDPIPSTLNGCLLSLSDKIDSIVGVIGLGVDISGSKDPFGLRREAQGVCKIILERKLNFSLRRLLKKVIKTYENRLKMEPELLEERCLEFFHNRLEYIYSRQGYRYDLIKAALGPGVDNVYYSWRRLSALDNLKDTSRFSQLTLLAKRVNNILRDIPPYRLNSDLFQEKEEKELYSSFLIIKENVSPFIRKGDFLRAYRMVLSLQSPINNFFDHVLVMVEDKKIRRNRLALLQQLKGLFDDLADFSQIVIEG